MSQATLLRLHLDLLEDVVRLFLDEVPKEVTHADRPVIRGEEGVIVQPGFVHSRQGKVDVRLESCLNAQCVDEMYRICRSAATPRRVTSNSTIRLTRAHANLVLPRVLPIGGDLAVRDVQGLGQDLAQRVHLLPHEVGRSLNALLPLDIEFTVAGTGPLPSATQLGGALLVA